MGLENVPYCKPALKMPRVAAAWQEVCGQAATEADIDRLYKDFIPYQLNLFRNVLALIPSALATFENITKRGAKISNTGYASMMIGRLVKDAADQGCRPDCIVTS